MHGDGEHGSAAARHTGRLAWALGLTATYMFAEFAGGLITGSLALLADAAHMLTDVAGLALALIAIRFAAREATSKLTYGYLRLEVLSALTNAVVLLLLTVYIIYEAYQRFLAPPEVLSGPMLAVAVVGLIVNLISMRLLAGGSSESLNVKGAYFEVLGDMLGSLGVIAAALLMMWKGWRLADPIIGAGIGLFIVPRTWVLLKQVTNILMEGTPAHIDVNEMQRRLLSNSRRDWRPRPPRVDHHVRCRRHELPPCCRRDVARTDPSAASERPGQEGFRHRSRHHSDRGRGFEGGGSDAPCLSSGDLVAPRC